MLSGLKMSFLSKDQKIDGAPKIIKDVRLPIECSSKTCGFSILLTGVITSPTQTRHYTRNIGSI